MRAAVERWLDLRRARHVLRRVLMMLMQNQLALACWWWHTRAEQQLASQEAAAAVAESAETYWRAKQLRGAHRGWRAAAALVLRVKKVVRQWQQLQMGRGWRTWRTKTFKRREATECEIHVIQQWLHWKEADAWRTWRQWAAARAFKISFLLGVGFQKWRLRSSRSGHRTRIMTRFLVVWRQLQTARACRTWASRASWQVWALKVVYNALQRLMHQELAKALWMWSRSPPHLHMRQTADARRRCAAQVWCLAL